MYVYLLGGLGNNLFQVNHGLLLVNRKVVFVTNIIESGFWSRIFKWSFHEPTILKIRLQEDIYFKRLNTLVFLAHLLCLKASRVLRNPFLGVSWESVNPTRVNFGYYQDNPSEKWVLKFRSEIQLKRYNCVLHMRLGDSPTLQADLDAQMELLDKLKLELIHVVTNDKRRALKLLKNTSTHFEFLGGTVIDDLEIMRGAKKLIIPQSTFSLIAVFSSQNLETLYVTEKFWKKKGKKGNHEVIYY